MYAISLRLNFACGGTHNQAVHLCVFRGERFVNRAPAGAAPSHVFNFADMYGIVVDIISYISIASAAATVPFSPPGAAVSIGDGSSDI